MGERLGNLEALSNVSNYMAFFKVVADRPTLSWFPFPMALRDFSREFNEAAGIINRAFACNFREAASFKQVQAVGLLLCFIGVPVVVFWGDVLCLGWFKHILGADQWSIQKVLILIVSVVPWGWPPCTLP